MFSSTTICFQAQRSGTPSEAKALFSIDVNHGVRNAFTSIVFVPFYDISLFQLLLRNNRFSRRVSNFPKTFVMNTIATMMQNHDQTLYPLRSSEMSLGRCTLGSLGFCIMKILPNFPVEYLQSSPSIFTLWYDGGHSMRIKQQPKIHLLTHLHYSDLLDHKFMI